MRFRRLCEFITLFCICLSVSGPGLGWDKLDIRAEQDTAYLPLRYIELNHRITNPNSVGIRRRFFVMRQGHDTVSAEILSLSNPPGFSHRPSISAYEYFPSQQVIDNDVFQLTILDCQLTTDTQKHCESLIGAGFRSDSAFFFSICPESEEMVHYLYLCSGRDTVQNGIYEPEMHFAGIMDYDFDGKTEAFLYLTSRREVGPRRLYCIEVETMCIEWELDVASQLYHQRLFSCGDSTNPAIMFITGNPNQGVSDRNYRDSYAYVSIVNSRGEVVFNRVLGVRECEKDLVPTGSAGEFFLLHQCPLVSPDSVRKLEENDALTSLYRDRSTISRIDSNGHILDTIQFPMRFDAIDLIPYGKKRQPTLFIVLKDGSVLLMNRDFSIIGQSGPTQIGYFVKSLFIPFYGDVLAFSDGLYDAELNKLAHFPINTSQVQIVRAQSDSLPELIGLSNGADVSIGYFEKRNFADLASVFYHRNENYVLMLVSGLLVGLIAILYYRGRDKHALALIQHQKLELEKTHLALREAQSMIIAQEKFKQAKDIAGGFAHEIRNALFPAEGILQTLLLKKDSVVKRPELLEEFGRDARSAVEKAIDITELISQYTRLDSQYNPESTEVKTIVEEVVEANKLRIGQLGVRIQTESLTSLVVVANRQQLYIVFNNLLLNSLDAFEAHSGEKTIRISGAPDNSRARISFADTGPGIAPENRDEIFNTFYSTKPDKGTGIGLAMVRKIIEMYGGEIALASERSGGAEFTISLPFEPTGERHD